MEKSRKKLLIKIHCKTHALLRLTDFKVGRSKKVLNAIQRRGTNCSLQFSKEWDNLPSFFDKPGMKKLFEISFFENSRTHLQKLRNFALFGIPF